MPGVSRKTVDSAGGQILEGSADVSVNGQPAVTVGDAVERHGRSAHSGSRMSSGSPTVFVNGKPLCREGDAASCGHQASGSADVSSG
jgi:uncharacterized Zn-binding protein involved in type VI secretion